MKYYIMLNDNIVTSFTIMGDKMDKVYLNEGWLEVDINTFELLPDLPAHIEYEGDKIIGFEPVTSKVEQDLIDNLKPNDSELNDAAWEIKTIDLLLELGVI